MASVIKIVSEHSKHPRDYRLVGNERRFFM